MLLTNFFGVTPPSRPPVPAAKASRPTEADVPAADRGESVARQLDMDPPPDPLEPAKPPRKRETRPRVRIDAKLQKRLMNPECAACGSRSALGPTFT
jgi:hypothetical protein